MREVPIDQGKGWNIKLVKGRRDGGIGKLNKT